jgi:hypothetical protein
VTQHRDASVGAESLAARRLQVAQTLVASRPTAGNPLLFLHIQPVNRVSWDLRVTASTFSRHPWTFVAHSLQAVGDILGAERQALRRQQVLRPGFVETSDLRSVMRTPPENASETDSSPAPVKNGSVAVWRVIVRATVVASA